MSATEKAYRDWQAGNAVTDETPLLSEVITGEAPGRRRAEQVTFFSNNEGAGIQFAAVGAVILSQLKDRGSGFSWQKKGVRNLFCCRKGS